MQNGKKTELISVCAISNPEKDSFWCGAHNFTPQHISQCKAVKKSGKSGSMGNFARCCSKFKNSTGNHPRGNSNAVRTINHIAEEDSGEGSYNESTNKIVLTIGGIGEAPFVMKRQTNNNKVTAMTDSGSQVTISTTEYSKDILRTDVLFATPLPQWEKCADFNQQPLKIAEFIHKQLKVGKQEIKTARILVAATGRSLVGQDWMAHLQYQIKPLHQISSSEIISMISSHLINCAHSSEVDTIDRKDITSSFPRLFTPQRKVIGQTIEVELKPEIKIIQQKGRRVPLQLQESVPKRDTTSIAWKI